MTAIRAELEAKSPMICYSGALVVDEEDHPIYSVAMPQEVAMKLCRRVYELNPKISVNIYTNDEWLVKDKKEYWAAQESDITGVIPQEVSFEDEEVYKEVHKVLCMGDKEDIAALEQQLVKEFPQIRIYRSKDTYLEIMSMKSIQIRCNPYVKRPFSCVKQEEIMAFGDNFNDIDMIRYAGTWSRHGQCRRRSKNRQRYCHRHQLTMKENARFWINILNKFETRSIK